MDLMETIVTSPAWAGDAKRATDTARAKVRKVLVGATLDREDREYLQSAIVALDWVRGKLGELSMDEDVTVGRMPR